MVDHAYIELGANAKPLTGQIFGRLTVLGPVGRSANRRHIIYLCRCSCGKLKEIRAGNLRAGRTNSCGCLNVEVATARVQTHQMYFTRAYKSWSHMKERCRNTRSRYYPEYGGRGIDYCDDWELFEQFYADMGDRPAGKTLDRIDNSQGYSKANCRWATWGQQQNNKRSNVMVDYRGERMTLAQATSLSGTEYKLAHRRITDGWSVEDALHRPRMKNQFGGLKA